MVLAHIVQQVTIIAMQFGMFRWLVNHTIQPTAKLKKNIY